MTRRPTHLRYVKKASVLFVSITLVFTSLYPATQPKEAEAVYSVVEVGKNLVVNTLSSKMNALTAGGVGALVQKEFVLDDIAWMIAKIALQQITSSIVNWINSGFQGSPSFVSDLSGFLLDIADIAAGEFIFNGPLQALCSPFQIDIQYALSVAYQADRNPEERLACRLSDVFDNVEGALGSFASQMSNWDQWFAVTVIPQNNLYGSLLLAEQEFGLTVRSAQGEEAALLSFGEGFLSLQQCEPVEGGGENCAIVTPGQVIEEQLNEALGLGDKSLIEADEINEILAALFAQLTQQLFSGVNGLLGLSSNSYNNGASYLEQMAAQTASSDSVGFSTTGGNEPMVTAIGTEEDWRTLQEEIIALVNSAQSALQRTGSCTSLSLPSSFTTARADAQQEVVTTNSIISQLQLLQSAFAAATTPEEEADILEQFSRLQASGLLHTEADVVLLEFDVDDLAERVNQFINRVEQDRNNCSPGGGIGAGSDGE